MYTVPVELEGHPGTLLAGPLVDGEALGSGRVEQQSHIRDVVRLPCNTIDHVIQPDLY